MGGTWQPRLPQPTPTMREIDAAAGSPTAPVRVHGPPTRATGHAAGGMARAGAEPAHIPCLPRALSQFSSPRSGPFPPCAHNRGLDVAVGADDVEDQPAELAHLLEEEAERRERDSGERSAYDLTCSRTTVRVAGLLFRPSAVPVRADGWRARG